MLNLTSAMLRRVILAGLGVTALLLVPAVALGDPVISLPTGAPQHPDRIVNGVDLQQSTRPMNLNPFGISYSDCIQDMTLRFSVAVVGLDGTETVQIWGTRSGDCTAPTTRGFGTTANTCWLLGSTLTGMVVNTVTTYTVDVRVQDVVGPQNMPPFGQNQVHEGSAACTTQSTFTPVPMDIWFMAVTSDGAVHGMALDYNIGTDMVGPPAPSNVTDKAGDTLLVINWTPNTDSDTAGYDVFIDPIPGQEEGGVAVVDSAAPTSDASLLQCPDTGGGGVMDVAVDDGEGGTTDAAADATVDSSTPESSTMDVM
jgi:hypothetical protein